VSGVAIAGAAEFGLGEAGPGWTAQDLMAQAALLALADCGLTPADVDGLFAASTQLPWASINLGQALGVRPRVSDSTMVGGSSPIAHIAHARAAIAAGACEVALIAYGSTQRSVGRANASRQEVDPYEAPYEPMLPIAAYALAASRHMHEFGTTPEDLAWVAVSARRWAQRTPGAWSTKDLDVQDVLDAPRVCDPLGVKDCCLITDGAGAIVLCGAERAATLARPPVHVLGVGEAHWHRHVGGAPSLTTTAAVDSGARAFAEAGVTHADVGSLQLYDAFTITPILFVEDLGFCAKGEGGAYFAGGGTGPGGDRIPVCTNGGGLSYAHPGMNGLVLLNEGVRRIRDQGDDVTLVHGNGGVLSSQCTVILGSAAAAS
jgi:acetyl-CoA acetyltransferase